MTLSAATARDDRDAVVEGVDESRRDYRSDEGAAP
jgi:hypothetical protein